MPPSHPPSPSAVWGTKLHGAVAQTFWGLGRTKLLTTHLPASCLLPLLTPGPVSRPQTHLASAVGCPWKASPQAATHPPPSLQQQGWNQLWVPPDLFHMPSKGLSHRGLINHEPDPLRIILITMFIVSRSQEIPSPHPITVRLITELSGAAISFLIPVPGIQELQVPGPAQRCVSEIIPCSY